MAENNKDITSLQLALCFVHLFKLLIFILDFYSLLFSFTTVFGHPEHFSFYQN